MSHHAGETLHYHDVGKDRYGHVHPFLSIMHDHDEEPRVLCAHADRNGEGAHWKREGELCPALGGDGIGRAGRAGLHDAGVAWPWWAAMAYLQRGTIDGCTCAHRPG